jgi:hypothetical protein
MAKPGLFLSNIGPFLRDRSRKGGWVLCVGAGSSVPMFPGWNSFVERLIAKDVGDEKAHGLASMLLSQYSPDALIQAAHDRLGVKDEEFIKLLSVELYRDWRSCITPNEWDFFTTMLSARVGEYRRSQWIDYLQLIRNHFPSLTALSVAKIISDTLGSDIGPSAIMSFNAEPLLASLINGFLRLDKLTAREAATTAGQKLDLVTHSISNRTSRRVPYYFIHGFLPVPVEVKKLRAVDASDKLVFLESEYLQMANAAFSWQSSVFLELAAAQSVVFIGMSLSDPNKRRWLSWVHTNRMKELGSRYMYRGASTAHYWIRKKPATEDERLWIESSVEHLGVRVVWLNEWDQIGDALGSMLGLTAAPPRMSLKPGGFAGR